MARRPVPRAGLEEETWTGRRNRPSERLDDPRRHGWPPVTTLMDSRTQTMAALIAETAAVDPRAEIAEGVEIGPYCVVGPAVMAAGTPRLIAHVCLLGCVEMGESNVTSPFTVIGGDPQDVSYHGAR